METYPTLSNPPITEAVIEIRFSPSAGIEILKSACDYFELDFPKVKPVQQSSVSWKVEGGEMVPGPQESGLDHFRLSSNEDREIIQLKRDRFAFSFVGHYLDWDGFSQQALKAWEQFANKVSIEVVTRLGVRFINNLNLPQETDLNKFITNLPQIPLGIPAKMAGFLNQITLSNKEISAFGQITLALDRNRTNEKKLPVIFDIDVFNLEQTQNKIELLQKKLLDLRNFKNQIFFNSLTQNGLELYK